MIKWKLCCDGNINQRQNAPLWADQIDPVNRVTIHIDCQEYEL